MGRRSLLPDPRLRGSAHQDSALRLHGACVEVIDPEMFYDDGRIAEAKAVCALCPLVQLCLAHALKHENFGIWGGTTPEERDMLRGTKLLGTPEDARWADAIRDRVRRGDLPALISKEMDVSIRTLERWLAADKKCGVTNAA